MNRDFADWIYRTIKFTVRENRLLKVVARPGMSQAEFMTECTNAARSGRDLELAKSLTTIDRQIDSLERKLEKEQGELLSDQEELSSRTWEQTHSIAENVIGVFSKGRTSRLKRAMEKNRMKDQAEADVKESQLVISPIKEQLADLQRQKEEKTQEITARWGEMVDKVDNILLTPRKSDVFIEHFGIAWMPFYQVATGDQMIELPAFEGE